MSKSLSGYIRCCYNSDKDFAMLMLVQSRRWDVGGFVIFVVMLSVMGILDLSFIVSLHADCTSFTPNFHLIF